MIRAIKISQVPFRSFHTASKLLVHQTDAKKSSILFTKATSSTTSFDVLNLKSLQTECQARGLKKAGRKMELIDRLNMFEASKKRFTTSAKQLSEAKGVDAVKLPSIEDQQISYKKSVNAGKKYIGGVIVNNSADNVLVGNSVVENTSTPTEMPVSSASTLQLAAKSEISPSRHVDAVVLPNLLELESQQKPVPISQPDLHSNVIINNTGDNVAVGGGTVETSEKARSTKTGNEVASSEEPATKLLEYPETFGEFVRCLAGLPPKPAEGESFFFWVKKAEKKVEGVEEKVKSAVEHNPKDFGEFVSILFGYSLKK
ncbi:hypothetical protein BABINDRAFT_69725 [Babjeviella inositovora NRRL Y-12698]|uniref:SAP domain-containing protein n=1 Tax=Babjeviella inositovora NRRL Y-12698 TaxID=984486 RepID=A0A1E3QX52_9ASCO|nr:uncharacterized protein BABINDRAFT_69725 [Babjeviella inositovora NRRL Y-12698]ODQ82265.1 hypothetical protein BABINDRAFT_69725 [Babjeviella inositovora NRRL Y-12698]